MGEIGGLSDTFSGVFSIEIERKNRITNRKSKRNLDQI
jgi:hypothetical protein